MSMVRRLMTVTVKSVDEQRGIIVFMGTTPTKDRYGDIVVPKGGDLAHYRKNPVFLWAHDYRMPPIGKSVREIITDQGIEFHIQFDLKDDFAVSIFRKYKEGFLSATSIGFQPQEYEPLEGGGYKYTKWGLLELSGVPVPANPDALGLALRGLSDKRAQEFAEEILRWGEAATSPPELADGPHEDAPDDGEIPKEYVVDVDPDTDSPVVYSPEGKALGVVTITAPAVRFFAPEHTKAGDPEDTNQGTLLDQIGTALDDVDGIVEALRTSVEADAANEPGDPMDEAMLLFVDELENKLDDVDETIEDLRKLLSIDTEDENKAAEVVAAFRRAFEAARVKAGAVLNKVNKTRLGQIKTLVDEVLASADSAPDETDDTSTVSNTAPVLSHLPIGDPPPNPPANAGPLSINPHAVANAVKIAVEREVRRALGKAPLI